MILKRKIFLWFMVTLRIGSKIFILAMDKSLTYPLKISLTCLALARWIN